MASSTEAALNATSTTRPAVTSQGGIIEGADPTKYDSKNPIVLFIIQAIIIIMFCRLLHFPLSKLRQPRVIAEVIGGVLLGPSVMMRIPGFQKHIFPQESMSNLNLVANIGLLLFLFVVGLEVDMRTFIRNWKVAMSVGIGGLLLPFGLGCAVSYGLYHQFNSDAGIIAIDFPIYMLFIGTALSITAFPVLCRILTELQLLHTPAGITALAAGVGNDVVGWILLALCVALVNNGSGIAALYVLLTAIGWVLFVWLAVKPVFMWTLRKSGSLERGPSQAIMALTLLLTLFSAWFTAVIGIHPIFGAFIIGFICPHDGGFARKVTEKIEDLVSVFFLPLYFALSGLSTNLGALDDGITWAYIIAIMAIAFITKITGAALAARANGMLWGESAAIGVLMSCKGLVEIIVLNIGLQARILSTRTFSMFLVMALITTFATTPIVGWLYPISYQRKVEAWKRGEIEWDGTPLHRPSEDSSAEGGFADVLKDSSNPVRRLLVYLRLDSLPSLFTFIALLGGDPADQPVKRHRTKLEADSPTDEDTVIMSEKRPLEVHGLRMLELTERTSTVMQMVEIEEDTQRDPVINAFRTFAQLHSVAASGTITVVPEGDFAPKMTQQAAEHSSDFAIIPWTSGSTSLDFDDAPEAIRSDTQEWFVQRLFASNVCNTAIFIDRGFGGGLPPSTATRNMHKSISGLSMKSLRETAPPRMPVTDRSHHVFFPFFGGRDDRTALRFVLQLAASSNVTVTIVHYITPTLSRKSADEKAPPTARVTATEAHSSESGNSNSTTSPSAPTSPRIGVVSPPSAPTSPRLGSHAGFDHALERVDTEVAVREKEVDLSFVRALRDGLFDQLASRVVFSEVSSRMPISAAVEACKSEVGQSPRNAGDLIVVGRGGRIEMAGEEDSSVPIQHAEHKRLFGAAAEALMHCGARASVVVVRARMEKGDVKEGEMQEKRRSEVRMGRSPLL